MVTESLGTPPPAIQRFFFSFLFPVAWLYIGNVSKIPFKAQRVNLCKVARKYEFFSPSNITSNRDGNDLAVEQVTSGNSDQEPSF